MLRWRAPVFGVTIAGGVVTHVVAELVTQRDGVRMIMMICARLMREGGIEGDAFIDVSIAVPQSAALDFGRPVPVKGIAVVEESNAIDEIADRPETGQRLSNGHGWVARNTIKDARIRRIVWEQLRLRRVKIPRSHRVTRKST